MTKPTKPRAKVRKPRPWLSMGAYSQYTASVAFDTSVRIGGYGYDMLIPAAQCRLLAAWLLKAADYLDAKEKGGG